MEATVQCLQKSPSSLAPALVGPTKTRAGPSLNPTEEVPSHNRFWLEHPFLAAPCFHCCPTLGIKRKENREEEEMWSGGRMQS